MKNLQDRLWCQFSRSGVLSIDLYATCLQTVSPSAYESGQLYYETRLVVYHVPAAITVILFELTLNPYKQDSLCLQALCSLVFF